MVFLWNVREPRGRERLGSTIPSIVDKCSCGAYWSRNINTLADQSLHHHLAFAVITSERTDLICMLSGQVARNLSVTSNTWLVHA